MQEQVQIFLKSVHDKQQDFIYLFGIFKKIQSYRQDVTIDFSKCHFLRPNAIAFLGGLSRFLELNNRRIIIDINSIRNMKVKETLAKTGFISNFTSPQQIYAEDAIPYREDLINDVEGIMDYLTYSWIGKGWVHVSPRLRDAIAGNMWEIYNNAFEHSYTPNGLFSCGHYYKKQNELILTLIDFGKGISQNVKEFFINNFGDRYNKFLTNGKALQWALSNGTTTSTSDIARGLGLNLLKEFIQLNNGRLEIYANEDYACISSDKETFTSIKAYFQGTIIHITLICDECLYKFSDE